MTGTLENSVKMLDLEKITELSLVTVTLRTNYNIVSRARSVVSYVSLVWTGSLHISTTLHGCNKSLIYPSNHLK